MAKQEYILKRGQEHIGFDKDGLAHTYRGGEKGNDRVMLSEQSAHAFRDKFESVAEQNERIKLQDEVNAMQGREELLKAKLAAKGMTLEDFYASLDAVEEPEAGKGTDDSQKGPGIQPAAPKPAATK